MSTKQETGAYDCYANLLPDEPYFLLMARDPDAQWAVREWASRREAAINAGTRPESDREKVREAFEVERQMVRWQRENAGQSGRQPAGLRD